MPPVGMTAQVVVESCLSKLHGRVCETISLHLLAQMAAVSTHRNHEMPEAACWLRIPGLFRKSQNRHEMPSDDVRIAVTIYSQNSCVIQSDMLTTHVYSQQC